MASVRQVYAAQAGHAPKTQDRSLGKDDDQSL
jgi:hypothetical protein